MNNSMISFWKKYKKYISGLVAIVILGGGYYWYSHRATIATTQYKTAVAAKGSLTVSISASGEVVVDQQATVDPTITGTVSDLAVKVGEKVTKGQFLFNIINDDLGVTVANASASYEKAKNDIASAELAKKEAKAAYETAKDKDDEDDDAYSSLELKNLKEKIDIAEDNISEVQKTLVASRLSYQIELDNANKRRVTAPIAGTINAINISNGDDLSRNSNSSSSEAPIIIGDLSTSKVEVDVNEVDIANVSVGQKVNLTLSAFEGETFSGQVEKIDSLGTTNSGIVTYTVTIGFDQLDSRIKPGMSVSATIITDVKKDIILVPSSAVKTKNGKNYVEVLKEGVAEQINVEVGSSSSTQTEIKNGLEEKDMVIIQTISSSSSTSTTSSKSSNRGPGMMGF